MVQIYKKSQQHNRYKNNKSKYIIYCGPSGPTEKYKYKFSPSGSTG